MIVIGARGLVSYVRCMEGAGNRTYDPNGLLNVKLSGCSWSRVLAPTMKKVDIPHFMLNDPEEVEGFFGEAVGSSAGVKELTGVFKRAACASAQGDMAVESSEVVCLCYRVKTERTSGADDMSGDSGNRYYPLTSVAADSAITTNTATPTTIHSTLHSSVLPLSDEMKEREKEKEATTEIEGYLDWCERGSRSRFNGTVSASGSFRH